ncbi:hypothetical protein Avbf_00893 [Armadillidium vulgare]|nr:hypothetical protein Avbf_00893 [Armadillidium vulgare]
MELRASLNSNKIIRLLKTLLELHQSIKNYDVPLALISLANFSGTEETRSPTEAEDVKQPEIEETKSSQQPSVGQSVGTYSATSLHPFFLRATEAIEYIYFSFVRLNTLTLIYRNFLQTSKKILKNSSIIKKVKRFFSTGKPGSFSGTGENGKFPEPDDVRQPETEERKSSQPSDREFIGTDSTSPETSFESSQKIIRSSSVNNKLKSSFSTDKSASFSVTEETKSPTEAEDVKQPEIEETKSSRLPSDEQFIGTESTSSPETSYEVSSMKTFYICTVLISLPVSQGAEETRNSEPEDVCKPEFQEEICSQEPEFKDAKSSQQLEIEDAKFSGKPEFIRSFIFSEDSITSDSSDRLYIADDRLSTPERITR